MFGLETHAETGIRDKIFRYFSSQPFSITACIILGIHGHMLVSVRNRKSSGNSGKIEQILSTSNGCMFFFRISWDQLGNYDIPSVLNYILQKTGQSKLSYVGHSLGCAMFFIAMINHPALNDKIEVMVSTIKNKWFIFT